MTALDLITRSHVLAGIAAVEDTLPGPDANNGLLSLNSLLESLRLQGLTVSTVTRVTKAIVSGSASYTVGVGADIVAERPLHVDAARLLLASSPDIEIPLQVLLQDEWERVTAKDQTSTLPSKVYYNPTFPLGTLYVHPVATDITAELVLYLPTALTAPALLSTVLSLPPGYERMLRYNLAVDLCAEYQRPVDPNVRQIAIDALAWLKRNNVRPALLRVDPFLMGLGGGGRLNIKTGEV
jgi:hypothetical protein